MSLQRLAYLHVLAFLTLFISLPIAFAGEYRIDVTATLEKAPSAASIYGLADSSTTITMSFEVDDTNAVLVPAGTTYNSSDTLDTNTQLFIGADVKSLSLGIGTATWDASHLQTSVLGESGYLYDALLAVTGPLADGATPGVSLYLNNSVNGEVSFGEFVCSSGVCSLANNGFVLNYEDGTQATILNIQAVVTDLSAEEPPPTPTEKLADLMALVSNLENETGHRGFDKFVDALEKKLEAAHGALTFECTPDSAEGCEQTEERNRARAIKHVEAFIKNVDSNRGAKILSNEQTAELTAAAEDLLSSL